MALTLGTKPESLKVLLNPGADLMFSIRSVNSPWAVDVQLILEVGTHRWTATIGGDLATWVIDQAEVDNVIAEDDLTARLWYVQPGLTQAQEVRLLLARGVAVPSG